MLCSGAFSVPSFRAAGGTSLGGDILRPFRTSFARSVHPSPVPHTSLMSSSSCCVLFPQLRTRHSSRYYRLSRVTFWCPQQGVFLGADVWFSPGGLCEVSFPWLMQCCPFGCICGISVRWNMLGASRASMRGLLLRADVGSPLGGRYRVTVRG